jgi:hypothetical protein
MTTVPAPAASAQYFDPEIVRIDQDLACRFVSPTASFEEVVASAEESGNKVFLALAASPVKRREEELRQWRAKQVARFMEIPGINFRQYGESIESERWEKIKAGECALLDIDHDFARFLDAAKRERSSLHTASREALKAVLHKAVQDPGADSTRLEIPETLYFSEDGEVLFFRRWKNARKYGKEQGKLHLLVNISLPTARVLRGSGS